MMQKMVTYEQCGISIATSPDAEPSAVSATPHPQLPAPHYLPPLPEDSLRLQLFRTGAAPAQYLDSGILGG
jgi:hypothetical protein